jgi:hypothetical protein
LHWLEWLQWGESWPGLNELQGVKHLSEKMIKVGSRALIAGFDCSVIGSAVANFVR